MSVSVSAAASPSVLRMAAPLVVSFWMRAGVTLIDTVYAARVGDSAVAAIGLTVPFEFIMIAVWVGLSTGLTSGLSRAMGAREGARIEQYLRRSWRLVAIISPLFTLLAAGVWIFGSKVGLEATTARQFQIYGTVLIGGSAFTTFWSIIPDSLIKAHQDTRSTMWAGIITNVINVSLNTVFVFVFEWGVFGIALSTVLARIGGLAYALARARFHERRRIASGETSGTEIDPHPYRTILALAIPSSITFVLIALETGAVNGLLAHMEHATETIAAYSIYYRVVLFSLQPVIATSVAMLPFAARRFGAKDLTGVRRGLRQTGLATSAYALLALGPVMMVASPWIADRLSESVLTREYTTFALRTVPLACFTGALFLLCRPVFEAMNRWQPGLVMAVVRYLILTVPLAWSGMVVAHRLGHPPLYGLIGGLLVTAAISSTAFALWLRSALKSTDA
jgi:Na+-driven multidrug efflux pump